MTLIVTWRVVTWRVVTWRVVTWSARLDGLRRCGHIAPVVTRRLLALLLLAAFIIGMAGDLIRRGDEYAVHVICPEHGEIMHARATKPTSDHGVKQLPTTPHGNGCALAVMGPSPTAAPPPGPLLAPAMLMANFMVPPDAPTLDRRAVQVLGYAPKTSPPVV